MNKIQFSQSPEDKYSRHKLIPWWHQEFLLDARVLVVGAGAIGNELVKNLALLGVGHLIIIDFDTVELSNLTRTPLFRHEDIGASKAEVAARRVSRLNPGTKATPIHGSIEFEGGLGLVASVDVVVGCLDNVEARLTVNQQCMVTGVPWINTGISDTAAEVTLYTGEGAACYNCTVPTESLQQLARRYSCTGLRTDFPTKAVPTTAVVSSLCASIAANETVAVLHSRDGAKKSGLAPGERLMVSTRPYTMGTYKTFRNEECHLHGPPTQLYWKDAPLSTRSSRAILESEGLPSGRVCLGYRLATRVSCPRCNDSQVLLKPIKTLPASILTCHACESERTVEYVDYITADHELGDTPLERFGVPPHGAVEISDEAQATRCFIAYRHQ